MIETELLIIKNFQVLLLIWSKILGGIFFSPVISSDMLPFLSKWSFAFLLSVICFPLVVGLGVVANPDVKYFFLEIVQEFFLGCLVGILLTTILSFSQIMGHLIATQSGINVAQIFDPLTQEEQSILGSLLQYLAILIFLGINGLHIVVLSLVGTYKSKLLNLGTQDESVIKILLRWLEMSFLSAIQIGAPLIMTSILLTFVLGIASKIVPQMNILVQAPPLQWLIVLIAFLLVLPGIVEHSSTFLIKITGELQR